MKGKIKMKMPMINSVNMNSKSIQTNKSIDLSNIKNEPQGNESKKLKLALSGLASAGVARVAMYGWNYNNEDAAITIIHAGEINSEFNILKTSEDVKQNTSLYNTFITEEFPDKPHLAIKETNGIRIKNLDPEKLIKSTEIIKGLDPKVVDKLGFCEFINLYSRNKENLTKFVDAVNSFNPDKLEVADIHKLVHVVPNSRLHHIQQLNNSHDNLDLDSTIKMAARLSRLDG